MTDMNVQFKLLKNLLSLLSTRQILGSMIESKTTSVMRGLASHSSFVLR